MIVFLRKMRVFFARLFGLRVRPEPKQWDLQPPKVSKKPKALELSRKRSYCWRCPWGKLHQAPYRNSKVECRLRGKVYGRRQLERGTVHCHAEARIRAGNIIVQPAG